MTTSTNRKSTRIFGWILMLAAIVVMLASIFTGAIRAGVAVPIGAMLLIFSIILLSSSKPGAHSDRAPKQHRD